MFSLNEKVVYPGYGVARVSRIVEKSVGGQKITFYEFVVLNNNMTVMIPIDRLHEVGIRKVSMQHIDSLFVLLERPFKKKISEIPTANWTKKSRVYWGGLRTGDLNSVCRIYQELMYISTEKELSYSEKKLLQSTENLLVEEILAATEMNECQAREKLRLITKKSTRKFKEAGALKPHESA